MFKGFVSILAHIIGCMRNGSQSARQRQRVLDARQSRRAISIEIDIWESTIIQVNGQTCIGDPVMDKQGTNRSEEDLMFRFEEFVVLQDFREFTSLSARACPAAERAENLDLR